MLYKLTGISDPLAEHLNNDPVRPHIPHDKRFGLDRFVYALLDDDDKQVKSMVCVKMCNGAPASEEELLEPKVDLDTIVFYTIWSYSKGAGQELLKKELNQIKFDMPGVKRFVTLSPTTEVAQRFHLKNGAVIYRINEESVNYEYK